MMDSSCDHGMHSKAFLCVEACVCVFGSVCISNLCLILSVADEGEYLQINFLLCYFTDKNSWRGLASSCCYAKCHFCIFSEFTKRVTMLWTGLIHK